VSGAGRAQPARPVGLVILAIVAASVAILAVAALGGGADADSLRLFIRSGARLSLCLFLIVFTASSLRALLPGPASEWLLLYRPYFGFGLAISHFSVAAVLLRFATGYPTEFFTVTYGLQRWGGAAGYLALAVLTVTSLAPVKRRIAPATWRSIHATGIWILFLSFLVSYTRRVFVLHDGFFVPFLCALALALALRRLARRRSARPLDRAPTPTSPPL